MVPKLTGQFALVTGASSGVGKAISLHLGAQGATLGLIGRRKNSLEAVARSARTNGQRVFCFKSDLTDDKEISRLRTVVRKNMGCLDILVHSAGIISLGSLEEAPVKNFDLQYRTNVRAPFLLTQALLPMLKSRQGQIVFVNSSVSLRGKANASQYAATKHALKALADSLREEVNPYGIRVVNFFLGRTASPMQEAIHRHEGRRYRPRNLLQPDDIAALVANMLSLPRTAEVTDIHIRPLQKS